MMPQSDDTRMRNASDRRMFPRQDTQRILKFHLIGGGELKGIARVLNVSRGGLQFASHEPIAPDAMLRMDINGTHDQVPLSLSGRVAWAHASPDEVGLYYSGVTFIDVRDDVREMILSALI